ncbi:MAG: hypothetical protein JKX84_00825, partial [Flavobacteriales bacterium]|nr:hypothetical protein [Flavobacteriales bacterium]
MKKSLLTLVTVLAVSSAFAQFRYLDEIFTSTDYTQDVVFGNNIHFIPSSVPPFPADLKMDMYEGTGDTETGRAAVIVLHSGNFLPKYFNQNPGGNNKDSSIVESCNLFAKRGYFVVAPNYRPGWNPLEPDQDLRTTGLINAVYRGLNDVKTCVRYL